MGPGNKTDFQGDPSIPNANKPTQVTPSHYSSHEVEPIDLIYSYGMGPDFCAGNVIKYVARHKEKNGREDVEKALYYLLRMLGFSVSEIKEIALRSKAIQNSSKNNPIQIDVEAFRRS